MAEIEKQITVSEQESNFLRFANLVIRICPKAVRAVFDKCFQPCGLGILLNQIKSKVEALCKKRIINKSQMDILYPPQGTSHVKSTDFDTTLMLCLLRNIQNMHVPVELPKPAEVTIQNDLSRINYYRNFIAHHSTGKLSNGDFIQAWTTLTEAVERLGGSDFKTECDHLLSIKIDSSFKEFYTSWVNNERRLNVQEQELKAVKSRVEELETKKDQYKENLYHDVEEWVEKDKLFFNTTAVTNIEEKVKSNSFVLISGASGMGKSASAFHIALKWKNEDNYEILPIIDPKDIMTYASNEINQIFIVDDFCGKFVADDQQCKAWQRLSVKLLSIFKKNQQTTRVVGTCRSNIACTKQVKNLVALFSIKVCDMLDDRYYVNLTEKRNIALQYLDEESFNKIDKEVINTETMFPLLCSISDQTAFDPELFRSPYNKYQEEFTKMLSENEVCFFGLVLLVLNNNKLDSNNFSAKPSEDFLKIFDMVWEDTDLDFVQEKPRKLTVLKQLRSIKGFLTREYGNIISALHDQIFDFISHFVCNKAPSCILKHGKTRFIQERVSLESQKDKNDTSFIVYLPKNLEHLFFNRMLAAFKTCVFGPFFGNLLSETTYYQEHMINRIKADNESLRIIVQNVWPLLFSGILENKLFQTFIVNEIKEFSRLSHENLNPCILEKFELLDDEMTKLLDTIQSKSEQSGANTMILCIAISERQLSFCDLFLNTPTIARDICYILHDKDADDNDDTISFICPLIESLKIIEKDEDTSYFDLLCPHMSSTDFNVSNFHSMLHWICNKCHNFTTLNTALNNLKFDVNVRDPRGRTPLYIACRENNECYVNILINHNCDVNIGDQNGVTPLMVACYNINEDIVNSLLTSKNCNPDMTDKLGNSALYRTARNNSVNIADLLIKRDALVNTHNNEKQSPLHVAAIYGSTEMIQFLVQNSYDLEINIGDDVGITPLMFACQNKHEEIVKILLGSEHCNPNLTDKLGDSALCEAVRNNLVTIADLLVKHGASVNTQNNKKQSPLHIAAVYGYKEIVQLLVQNSCELNTADVCGKTPLMLSCITGYQELVKLLLNHKCALNVVDGKGQTALHKAIIFNNYKIAELLVKTDGCNMDVRDVSGSTPVLYSVKYCNFDIMRLLLNHNCEVNIGDDVGVTPLMFACQIENEEIVKILLASENCNPNLTDKFGDSALSRAALNNSVKIADLLVKHGASVNTQNNENQSPLHIAAMSGCNEMIMFLVQNSCNVNIADSCGITPLMLSCQYRKLLCFKSLFYNGANLNVSDLCGWGWMHYARFKYNLEFFKILINHDRETWLNASDYFKQTPLIVACIRQDLKIVQFLLNQNCALNKQDTDGQTALHKAVVLNNCTIAELLVKTVGCNIDIRDVHGSTPFYYAVKNCSWDIMCMLLDYDCDANISNENEEIQLTSESLISNLTNNLGEPPLCRAARKDLIRMADFLINHGASVNNQNIAKQSPLHIAIMSDSNEMVQFLLQNSPEINLTDSFNRTPLMLSSRYGKFKFFKSLFSSGEKLNICDSSGWGWMHYARFGDDNLEFFKLLIEHDKEAWLNASDHFNQTPLVFASITGDNKLVTFLLNQNCVLDKQDTEGQSALHKAVISNNYEIVKLLVKSGGCIINVRDKYGSTPFYYAVKNCSWDIICMLLDYDCDMNIIDENGEIQVTPENLMSNLTNNLGEPPLCRAARKNSIRIANFLVKQGASVNNQNIAKQSPLHIAALFGCNEMVQFLLQNSSEINMVDSSGSTPLMLSCRFGQFQCFKTLFTSGAKLNLCVSSGLGWMYYAGDYFECFKLLIEHDKEAWLNATDHYNQTPLIFACITGKTKLVQFLLNQNCALDKQDTEGQTALHKAVISNNYRIIELLVETDGCCLDVRDAYGSTPLYYAVENGYSDIMCLLLLHGAYIDAKIDDMSPIILHLGLKSISEILEDNSKYIN